MSLRSPIEPLQPHSPGPSKPTKRPAMAWIWRVLYILYSFEVGMFLLILPWLSLWDNNYLLFLYPRFRPIVTNSFLKGAVLGLGLVNIFIGVQELASFRKRPRAFLSR